MSAREELEARLERYAAQEARDYITLTVTRPGGAQEKVRIPKAVVFTVLPVFEKLNDDPKTSLEVAYHISDDGRLKTNAAKAIVNILGYGSLRTHFNHGKAGWTKSNREQHIHDLVSASMDITSDGFGLFFNKAIAEQELTPNEIDMMKRGISTIAEYRADVTELHKQAAIAKREADKYSELRLEAEPDHRVKYENRKPTLPRIMQKALAELGLTEAEASAYFDHISQSRKNGEKHLSYWAFRAATDGGKAGEPAPATPVKSTSWTPVVV